mmetsp:Transcript_82419/g.163518  ORF Transcript_82419/g.163518 Transcript_82419/m.163518 type:complete len:217 (+) Transcript_82419:480-1130(+)
MQHTSKEMTAGIRCRGVNAAKLLLDIADTFCSMAKVSCTPAEPKALATCLTNAVGHATFTNSSWLVALAQPHFRKRLQPSRRSCCATVSPSNAPQSQTLGGCCPPPQSPDCAWVMYVAVRLGLPQTFEVLWSGALCAGTATSRRAPSRFPWPLAGCRPFFITTAVQSACHAEGLRTSMHRPHPPPPVVSLPQQPSSGPNSADRVSEVLPVNHNRSP